MHVKSQIVDERNFLHHTTEGHKVGKLPSAVSTLSPQLSDGKWPVTWTSSTIQPQSYAKGETELVQIDSSCPVKLYMNTKRTTGCSTDRPYHYMWIALMLKVFPSWKRVLSRLYDVKTWTKTETCNSGYWGRQCRTSGGWMSGVWTSSSSVAWVEHLLASLV